MSDTDWVLLLSRAQFSVTMGMHITLAALTLGLAPFLVGFEALWLWRKNQAARDCLHFWLKIFAITVAIGAVSGIVMEFQFGTNWAPFAKKVGGFIGPLLFYEILVAFFLESALTGVMLFGFNKIPPAVHFSITCLVALGAIISAFWILAANSWMQTPTGFLLDARGNFAPESWQSLLKAPSFPWRFSHMLLASMISVSVLLAGVAAWRLLKRPHEAASRLMITTALGFTLLAIPVQIVIGDLHGENTLAYQPQKVAAIEGSWQRPAPGEGEPMRLFAIPSQDAQRNYLELGIPDIGSLYLRHDLTSHIKSLREFPPGDIPPVALVFFSFRIMVGLGLLMLLTTVWATAQHLRGKLYSSPRLLMLVVVMTPAGFIAMLSGWVVTEVGRQPWTVYGLMRTAQSVSSLPLSWLIASCCGVALIYGLAFGLGLRYLLHYINAPLPQEKVPVTTHIQTSKKG